jgi:hypothetical protein
MSISILRLLVQVEEAAESCAGEMEEDVLMHKHSLELANDQENVWVSRCRPCR